MTEPLAPIVAALEAARHDLTTYHGLHAFDTTEGYHRAIQTGSDADGAWNAFQEETFQIDTTATLALLDAAIARLTGGA
jgi:hypothetical protein